MTAETPQSDITAQRVELTAHFYRDVVGLGLRQDKVTLGDVLAEQHDRVGGNLDRRELIRLLVSGLKDMVFVGTLDDIGDNDRRAYRLTDEARREQEFLREPLA